MKARTAIQKGIVILTTAALTVAGFTISPPAAPAAEGQRTVSPFGFAAHYMWSEYQDLSVIDRELDVMAANGARWLRLDTSWASFQQSGRGTLSSYFTNRLDYVVNAARQRGIEVVPVLLATPSWANGGRGYWVPPDNDADFAAYVSLMVSRYRGSITYWEIWNEPNWYDFWDPAPDAGRFTQMLQAAYTAAKRANPESKVISGGLVSCDSRYLQKMYDAGARGYMDYVGVHPYTDSRGPYYESTVYNRQWNYDGLAVIRETMVRNGDADKKVFCSEAGWTTSVNDEHGKGVSEELQAQYTEQAYERIMQEFPFVEVLTIYMARDKGTDPTEPEHRFGMVRRDFTAKPVLAAYKRAATTWYRSATIDASPQTIYNGGSSALTVQTPDGDTAFTLQAMVARGSWTDVATATTSAEGTAQITVKPTVTTSYRAVTGELTSNPVTVKVRAKASMKPSRRVVRPRGYVKLTGSVKLAKSTVVMLQRRVGRRWRNVRRIRTTSAGTYGVWVRLGARGRYIYRVRFYGNSSQLGTYSRPTPLRVR